MHPSPSCRTADFFVLRTPSLPVDVLTSPMTEEPVEGLGVARNLEASRERLHGTLRQLARNPAIREALALASPDLATRIDPWLEGLLVGGAAERVERALLRYLIRMSHRATPFGLFASVSTGRWKAASQLSVDSWSACRKAVRLDWGALEELLDRLARRPRTRAALRYRVNSSLHACAGWHRYLERRDAPGQERSYHLEAVEAS